MERYISWRKLNFCCEKATAVFQHWIFVESYWHWILKCVHLVILQKRCLSLRGRIPCGTNGPCQQRKRAERQTTSVFVCVCVCEREREGERERERERESRHLLAYCERCAHLKYELITDARVSTVGSIDWSPRVCAKVTWQVTLEVLSTYRRR